MAKIATLKLPESECELPILEGSEGERAIDITKLRAQTGYVTLDSGYMNTGACTSNITFLDGEKGILRYRGIDIAELAEKSNFMEVAYLLLNGNVPNNKELKGFEQKINSFGQTPQALQKMIAAYPRNAHPMGVMSSLISSLSAFYPELLDQDLSAEKKEQVSCLVLKQIQMLSAAFYRHSVGKENIESNAQLDYASDFVHQMFGEVDETVARAIDVLLILHADHEQNCSTSTVRMVGSSKANLFATISAGISALWGPLHGGANQQVVEMLEQIQAAGGGYKKFLEEVKDKSSSTRLMGFGHRVYKNFDPRAKLIKKAADDVLTRLGVQDPLLDIAKGLEEEALKDEYFVSRKLYPNVDFYSGIIYRALGIPTNMFTVMFALGRMPGWIAQWKEMVEDPSMKICRPRQIYTGAQLTSFHRP